MKWIAERWQELCGRYKIGFLTFIICVLLFLIATLLTWFATKSLYDQQAAKRWADNGDEYTQISCFYPISMTLSEFGFQSLHHSVEDALVKASIESESEDAKLFVDAYSTSGKLTIATENYDKEVKAIGVSDHFFLFHPIKMLTGSYFDENMIMKDGVILDEDTAFALYGSNDVVGMPVFIGNKPYYIRGVAAREDGYFAKKAGLSEAVCFVSIDTLETHGIIEGSYTYEVVMPNPVEGFARNIVVAALNDTEQKIEVVENTNRYSMGAKKDVLLDFGIRSMSRNSILYPYWENIARAKEDVCACLFVVQTIPFAIAVILLLWYVKIVYKNRTWSVRKITDKVSDAMYNRKYKKKGNDYEKMDSGSNGVNNALPCKRLWKRKGRNIGQSGTK